MRRQHPSVKLELKVDHFPPRRSTRGRGRYDGQNGEVHQYRRGIGTALEESKKRNLRKNIAGGS